MKIIKFQEQLWKSWQDIEIYKNHENHENQLHAMNIMNNYEQHKKTFENYYKKTNNWKSTNIHENQ